MTATTSNDGGVKFSRLPKRGVLLGLTVAQLVALGSGLVPLIAAIYTGGTAVVAVLPLMMVAAVVALVPVAGRPIVTWLPVASAWVWRTMTGQLEFRARTDRPRPAGTLALPGRAAALRLVTDPVTGAALVHDPHAATLTVTVPVTAGGFTLLDGDEQARRAADWGRVLATACRSGNLAALTVTERTLPGSGASLAQWWQAHGTHDDGLPATVYGELIERAGPTAERHDTAITLTLNMRTAARAVRAAGGGLTGAVEVLRQETHTISTALRTADLAPSPPLDAGGLAVRLRTAYDPGCGPLLERNPSAGRDPHAAGPIGVSESWGAVRADGSWHATLWISQWPQSAVHPGFLAPLLLTSGIQRTLTIRYEPVRPDAAARDLRRKKTGHLTEAAQRAKAGQIQDATQAAELDDVLAQEAELAVGHGVLRTTGLLTVTATEPDDLERDVAAVEQAAVQAGCETRRLWGQQAAALCAVAVV
ncbi:SCO6880 family protein [Myceligenerans crystallogenes]|uniref:Type VII secretion protein EccE n=1 Tax=Myceligenerans crystallogenes TaxID=316335 RepID=A0ABP4ZVJ5_9MICO